MSVRFPVFFLTASTLLSQQPSSAPPAPVAHFHHIHLNSTDPAAAIKFYTLRFDCEKARYGGSDAVWTQKSWILFNPADAPPPSQILSAIWHFGWGAEDMPAAYQKQLDLGTKFETPLTDISDLANYKGFYFAYVDAPDHALVEMNTAQHHHLGHIHLLSADPVAAGQWYAKEFGAHLFSRSTPSREPRFYKGFQVGPAASLTMDNLNIIIFPMEYAYKQWPELWEGRKAFESTKGRVVDHIAFSVDNLNDTLARLDKDGVKIVSRKPAFIEGPDRILIELVEGQAHRE